MKKRYWLRGGIIGILVVVISLAFLAFWSALNTVCGMGSTKCSFLFFFSQSIEGMYKAFVLYITLPIVSVGTLFGWLYGKIKNRKQITS